MEYIFYFIIVKPLTWMLMVVHEVLHCSEFNGILYRIY